MEIIPFEVSELFNANYVTPENIDLSINQGGTSCFGPNVLVQTSEGPKQIKDIKPGDSVLSYNEKTKTKEFKEVLNLFKYLNHKETVKVKMKNGKEIIATLDHKFYYEGGWHSLKHLLSLKYGKGNLEDNTRI